jgi:hypothetical protein
MCDAKEVLAVGGGGNVYAFYIGMAVVAVLRRRRKVVVAAAGESEGNYEGNGVTGFSPSFVLKKMSKRIVLVIYRGVGIWLDERKTLTYIRPMENGKLENFSFSFFIFGSTFHFLKVTNFSDQDLVNKIN